MLFATELSTTFVQSKLMASQHNPMHGGLAHHKLIYIIYKLVTQRHGISSLQVSEEIGVSEHATWYLLQRIREATDSKGTLLRGIVEADEIYNGGKEKFKYSNKKSHVGRGAAGKTPVFGLVERNGRVVAKVVDNTKADTLFNIFKKHVAKVATAYTDEFISYDNLSSIGHEHGRVNHNAVKYVDGSAHTNTID